MTLRRAEILALLAASPAGMSADLLTVQLYGDEGNPTTTRAELHRVRQILGDRISAKPYRLTGPFSADFLEVREHVLHGRTEEALALYSGPLLPASGSLAVEMLREELHTMMRRAVLQSGGAALESWVGSPTAPTTRRRSSGCSSSCPTTTRAAPSCRPGPTGWRPSSASHARGLRWRTQAAPTTRRRSSALDAARDDTRRPVLQARPTAPPSSTSPLTWQCCRLSMEERVLGGLAHATRCSSLSPTTT